MGLFRWRAGIAVLFTFAIQAIPINSLEEKDLNDVPYFGDDITDVIAAEGSTVTLVCTVHNIGNRTVSWIRVRDFHILTVGPFVFTSGMRFGVHKSATSDEWRLDIHDVRDTDQGIYECQVSADKPSLTKSFEVSVYNCGKLGTDCQTCINLPLNYTCAWNNIGGSCETKAHLRDGWIDKNGSCPINNSTHSSNDSGNLAQSETEEGDECNAYNTCSSCVSPTNPTCIWCISMRKCIETSAEGCKNDLSVGAKLNNFARLFLQSANKTSKTTSYKGTDACPRVVTSQEILIPSGTEKRIKVTVDSVHYFLNTRFSCVFTIEGNTVTAAAQLIADTVYCDSTEFSYFSDNKTVNVDSQFWGGGGVLDNSENIRVILYKCHLLATDCNRCVNLPSEYKCGWNTLQKTCEPSDTKFPPGLWIGKNEECPIDVKVTQPSEDSRLPNSDGGLHTRESLCWTLVPISGTYLPDQIGD